MCFANLFPVRAKYSIVSCAIPFLMCISVLTVVSNAQQQESRINSWEEDPFGIIESGMLFINDKFIPGPYDVQVTESEVTVNGVSCFQLTQRPYESRSQDNRPELRRQPGVRGQQWRGQQGPRRGEASPRGRRGGPNGGGGGRGERPGEQLSSHLVSDGLVVVRTGAETRYIGGKDLYTFCKAMIADEPDAKLIGEFAMIPKNDAETAHWKQWLLSFEPDTKLTERMRAEVERSDSMIAAAEAKRVATTRLEQLTYPLTIAGMLLSVLALGHLLKWATRIVISESSSSQPGDIIRCSEVALLLMLAMASIDLVWTILAGQAGVMREVNPLAAGMLKSPVQLVLFKVVATGLGFAILYAWRRRAQIQKATWWMCLVSVLLTFRWVVFDSMMN